MTGATLNRDGRIRIKVLTKPCEHFLAQLAKQIEQAQKHPFDLHQRFVNIFPFFNIAGKIIGFGGTASYDSTLNGKVLDLAIREAVNRLVDGIESGAWKPVN